MKLKYTILYVEDVKQSLQFYERAFGFEIAMLHESGDYGELKTGETTLSFSSRKLMRELGKNVEPPIADGPTFEIAFEVSDVEVALKKALEAGAKIVQDVRDEPWGQTTSYVLDNNNFLIEICSAIQSGES